MELVDEEVEVGPHLLRVRRPRDSDALIDEEAFARDEVLPYWAELWPSGVALARAVAAEDLAGRRVVELGCGGVALPSIAAALAGADVLATDWMPEAVALAADNAARNDASLRVATIAWSAPTQLLAGAPWDLVLGADVLYEDRNVTQLLPLLERLVGAGEVWIADPKRPPAAAFLAALRAGWDVTTTFDGRVALHRCRRRPPARPRPQPLLVEFG